MLLPKILYKKVSGTVASTAVSSNVVTVIVANDLAVGELVQMVSLTIHTELNHQTLLVASASGSQFTAVWTHANYSTAAEGGGSVYRVLLPTYPPVNKPGVDDRNAVREDSVTISGKVQSVLQRIEIFKSLDMGYVPLTDIPVWSKFIDNALTGAPFTYYPDRTDTATSTDYTLEDKGWAPRLAFKGMTKFTLKLRQLVS
jgi:hypothetical protein